MKPVGAVLNEVPEAVMRDAPELGPFPQRAHRREERLAPATSGGSSESLAAEGTSAASVQALSRTQKKAKKEKEKTKAKEKENRKEKGKKTTVPPAEEAGEESSRGATIGGKGTLSMAEPAQPTAVAASVSAPVAAPINELLLPN